MIKNNISRNNAKCKRKHNLIKKAMQLSKLCGQEIMLVVYDRNLSKITQYRSNELFDVSACHRLFEKAQAQNSIYSGNPKPNIGADIEL